MIKGYGFDYSKAIDISIKRAEEGYGLSCVAVGLCGYLLDPDTDADDLQGYIADFQSKARQAQQKSMMTLDLFRNVGVDLSKVQFLRRLSTLGF